MRVNALLEFCTHVYALLLAALHLRAVPCMPKANGVP